MEYVRTDEPRDSQQTQRDDDATKIDGRFASKCGRDKIGVGTDDNKGA